MECEICGAEVNTLYEIEVEGARMLVCEVCARGKNLTGRVVGEAAKRAEPSVQASHATAGAEEEEIVEDYGEEIRKAREKLGLPLKVLAERINEKASTLLRVEEQKTLPSEKLAKKLEKELGIKLEMRAPERSFSQGSKPEPLSLWEAASKKEKKGSDNGS
ncbi:MAG: multiprotein bridging factor aMBF1 [Candidatus Micrarchaeia archaeon]